MGGQEIARGLAKNECGVVPSDARIEAGNDDAQAMAGAPCGHLDFKRFGKRFFPTGRNAKRQKGTGLDAPFAQPPCGYSFGRLIFAQPP